MLIVIGISYNLVFAEELIRKNKRQRAESFAGSRLFHQPFAGD